MDQQNLATIGLLPTKVWKADRSCKKKWKQDTTHSILIGQLGLSTQTNKAAKILNWALTKCILCPWTRKGIYCIFTNILIKKTCLLWNLLHIWRFCKTRILKCTHEAEKQNCTVHSTQISRLVCHVGRSVCHNIKFHLF